MDTHKECVVTAIGTYTSELELNYTLDLSSEISLQKIRNVEIQTNFTASIASALSIKYGSGSNLEMEMHK